MNAVGIDVSKGKSTVAVLRPFGEVVASPFDVIHNDNDLKRLVELIRCYLTSRIQNIENAGKGVKSF